MKLLNLHHIYIHHILDMVLCVICARLLAGEIVEGAANMTKEQICNKIVDISNLFILTSAHLCFNYCIPNCWHTGWALEPKADSYFYTFLLKKKKKTSLPTTSNSTTMTCDAFPAEWMEKHSHVLTSLLCETRGSGLEKEREPTAEAACECFFDSLSKVFYSIAAVRIRKEGIVQVCVFIPWSECVHVSNRNNKLIEPRPRGGWRASRLTPHASQVHLETEGRGSLGGCCCHESFLSLLLSVRAFFFFCYPCSCFTDPNAHRRGLSSRGGLVHPGIMLH